MTLLTEKGTFTKTTSTSTPVSQQVNLSNGSLTPKIIILWTTGQTTINGTYEDDTRLTYGFSDGTNHACQAIVMDESAESERYVFHNDKVISIISLTAGSEVSVAHVSAVAAGSFTLSWTTQSDTSALHIHYSVIGGSDITDVSVVNTTTTNTTTGNHSWNGTGTTFTPDFALCMTGADSYTTTNTIAAGADRATISIGAVKSTTEQWVVSGRDETVATSDCDMYINNAACLANHDGADGSIDYLADFVSFNSAAGGGITLNVSNAATSGSQPLAFLFVKGGTWDCDVFAHRSGTGTQNVTLDTGLTAKLVFLVGLHNPTIGTVQLGMYIALGASDGTNEGCSNITNENSLTTFTAIHTDTNTKIYRQSTPAATAASSTIDFECDMSSMSTAGQFTLNWTTQVGYSGRQIGFWVVGPSAAAGNAVERAVPTETTTISETSKTLLRNKIRTRSETVTCTD